MKKTNLVVLVCLVVVGTILLVIPNLPGPRPNPSSAAIGYLRSILEAENQHHSSKGVYGTLEQLSNGDPPFLDGILGKMDLGYRISLAVGSEGKSFKAIAVPDKLDLRESHDSTNK